MVKNNSNKDDVIGFSIVDKTEDPTFFTGFLNDITKLESVQECKQVMRNLLSPQEAQSILDVGCGVGDDVRELARGSCQVCIWGYNTVHDYRTM